MKKGLVRGFRLTVGGKDFDFWGVLGLGMKGGIQNMKI